MAKSPFRITALGAALIGALGIGGVSPAASGAGFSFPATQSASSDANTLDDYEEGTFTPTLTFTTPGDVSVAYSTQSGRYTKIGDTVFFKLTLITSAFTFTTGSGQLYVSGLPFVVRNEGNLAIQTLLQQGINNTSFQQFMAAAINNSIGCYIYGTRNTGGTLTSVTNVHVATGASVVIYITGHYTV